MLLWFRNDLRTHDNPALNYFVKNKHANVPAKALFFISEKQWQAHDWSAIKIDFIKRHAFWLADELKSYQIALDIVTVADFTAQIAYLKQYCQQHGIKQVLANSELEVNEAKRDKQLIAQGIELTLFEADVIVPKGKVVNQSGQMYKVFTPFKQAWLRYVRDHGFEYLGKLPALNDNESHGVVQNNSPIAAGPSAKWPLANVVEQQAFPVFIQEKLIDYAARRDIPAIKGTSGLSPYLAAGVISPRYVLTQLLAMYPDILLAHDRPEFAWVNELIWREFYRHLMFHEPRLGKHQCFNNKYQKTRWLNNQPYFDAWCQGRTGYPLVDAAMRQLNQTGWMHNRLRMVVASFLSKHLLIDWRLGEKYFMQQLIDGDLAANNGGWQWAASTGCDAQPYFRIFNPIRQSERFDPNGEFIRKYIPELKDVPDKKIHFPHQYIADKQLDIYWPAIVEHKTARLNALAFYK